MLSEDINSGTRGGLLFYLLLRELPRHPRPQEDIGVDFVGQREVPSERG